MFGKLTVFDTEYSYQLWNCLMFGMLLCGIFLFRMFAITYFRKQLYLTRRNSPVWNAPRKSELSIIVELFLVFVSLWNALLWNVPLLEQLNFPAEFFCIEDFSTLCCFSEIQWLAMSSVQFLHWECQMGCAVFICVLRWSYGAGRGRSPMPPFLMNMCCRNPIIASRIKKSWIPLLILFNIWR